MKHASKICLAILDNEINMNLDLLAHQGKEIAKIPRR